MPDGRVAAGCFVGDEDAAALDLGEDATAEASQTSFIGFEEGPSATVPEGAEGPTPTRGPGMQYRGGKGGNGLDSNVTGVRIMDETPQNPAPTVYMNEQGQGVNPLTGQTIGNDDPWRHLP